MYHKKVTEEALHRLNAYMKQWENGEYPYDELTERIHEFHKENQEIFKTFTYNDREYVIFMAKKDMDLFNEDDLKNEWYRRMLQLD